MKATHIRTHEGAGSECYSRYPEPLLIPVPRGMCSAFYQFMGAGAARGDDGQIFMLNPRYEPSSISVADEVLTCTPP